MVRKLFLLIIGAVFSTPPLYAQQAKQYSFSHYTATMGLVSNQVNSVVQDQAGYIWVGTTDGLQRFDGQRYKTFRHIRNDSTSIPTNPIMQLLIDKKQQMWIVFANAEIGIFNTNTFQFTKSRVTLDDPKTAWSYKRLNCDEDGNLFLVLMGWGIITYNEKQNEFASRYNFIPRPQDIYFCDVVQQPGTKKYWIGLQNGGIAVYNQQTQHLNYAGHNPDKEPAVDKITGPGIPNHLFIDNKQRLWYDTWGPGFPYIFCYDTRSHQMVVENIEFITSLKTYYEINGLYQQRDGTIWLTGIKILAKFNEKEKKFQQVYNGYLNERSIYYDRVNALVEDREKNVWVATKNNGLYRFNPSEEFFTNVNHLNRISGFIGDGDVMSFTATKWGTVLVGCWGDGLYQYDKDFNLIPTNIKGIDNNQGPTVWYMHPSRDSNTIWIAAQPGLYRLDQNTRSVKFYNPPVLENRTMRQVIEDKAGNLWMSMQHIGLYKWTAEKGRKRFEDGFEKSRSVPRTMVNKLLVDHKGYLWAATSSEGLYVIDPTRDSLLFHFGKNRTGGTRLPEDGVSSILEYNDSLMIITTATTIHVYDRVHHTISSIGSPEILSGFIASMEKDRFGYVWITTTNGLYRVNIRSRVFIRFNRTDGIDNESFILNASGKLPDGRLLFGASNQFIAFDPAQMQFNKIIQPATITDFKVMNKSLRIDSLMQLKKIVLGPNNNSLEIEFSSLTYTTASLIRYKLDKLDKEWRVADYNNSQAVYSYIPPGTYTFMLSTTDPDGVSGQKITQLTITIKPPFWKSWWFFCLTALLLAIFLYWFDRERMRRKEALQKMRTDIADNLHEKVSTALNNINILSEMARLKADKDTQKSKEYIEQIHTKSHNMIIAMDDMLWSIDHENDSMKKTVERMKEYVDALENRLGVNIDILVDKKVESLPLNMKLRYESFLVFKEGIKNLISTGARNIEVYIGSDKSKLLFTTQFDNETLQMQELHNLLNRQDLEKRLESMNAKISIQVHKTNSVITLQIPVT